MALLVVSRVRYLFNLCVTAVGVDSEMIFFWTDTNYLKLKI